MNNATLELTETVVNFPPTPAAPAQTAASIAPASRINGTSRLAAWLLPPVSFGAVFLLAKVTVLTAEVFSSLNAIYASMQS